MRNRAILKNRLKLLVGLGLWLLFVPNSFYIITDLFHLAHIGSAPKWFDLLLIFSFAWNGIICGIISLRRIEIILKPAKANHFSAFIVFAVMWMNAFGIYIGRFLRFNSWDVLTNPFTLVSEIIEMVFHPFDNSYAWGMTVCYAFFMTLVYCTIRKLSESFITQRAIA